MAVQTKSPRNHAPESQSRPIALVLTLLLWVAALSVAILLPPGQLEKPAEPVYQSISLTLVPLSGISQPVSAGLVAPAGSASRTDADLSGGGISGEPAVSETASAAPKKKSAVTEQYSSTKQQDSAPSEPVAASVPPRTPAPAASSPVAPAHPPLAAAPSTTPAVSPSHDKKPVDPGSFDQAAWESLFAGSSTQYSNSVRQGGQSSALDATSSLSGVAATANPASSGAASDSSLSTGALQSVAAGTTESLSHIATAAAGDCSSAGASSTGASAMESVGMGAGSGSSAIAEVAGAGISLDLVGGGRRRLLEPAEPVISISRESQPFIPGSLEVTIAFEITPEGVVRPGSIRITPESLIHNRVQEEIKTQIGKWRFQAAEGYGQVRFKYNIMKK